MRESLASAGWGVADLPRAETLGVFAGKARPIPGNGRLSAIFKERAAGKVSIGFDGLEIDEQADRRVHGGPDKAVHQFPVENYRVLSARFPELEEALREGVLGENISSRGVSEETLCVGDVIAFGAVRMQVSQPRRPCWKIDARLGVEGVAEFVNERGVAGWYYRVLEPGSASSDHEVVVIHRNELPISLRELWDLDKEVRPELSRLERARDTPGLASAWRKRLVQRHAWLTTNVDES